MLAGRAGVELEPEHASERTEKDRLYGVLEQATFFFQKHLEDHVEAKKYILGRGLTESTIKEWRIGYAPLEWRLLHDFLLEKGFTKQEMERVGLIKKSEKGDHYDVFRGRIMFPIFDVGGKVIAFSGRILVTDDKSPKYLNTPETILFNKSATLYGLHKAKVDIRRKDYSIIVEGQMDLVMSHQAGFGNTVASSGTAFTAEHLGKLKRLSNRIIMAFDADGAGFTAANKSAQLALSLGMEVKIAPLPKGSDPAELIRTNISQWTGALKNALHIIDFYMHALLAQKKDPRNIGKEIQSKVLPYVAMLESSIERSHFISRIAQLAHIKEDALWEDLRLVQAPQTVRPIPADGAPVLNGAASSANPSFRKHSIEKKIIGICFWQQGVPDKQLKPDELMQRLKAIVGDEEYETLMTSTEPQRSELIFEVEAYYENSETLLQEVEELFAHLQEERLKEEFTRTMSELARAESAKDSKEIEKLLAHCQLLSKQIAALPQRK